jgi:predicted Zn-ribbon and HTH transcriptional regulator
MRSMQSTNRTPRQHVKDLLMATPLSSRQLAKIVGITEREVEDHITHIIKSVARDRSLRFNLEPCECRHCGFAFRDRSKITRPSRCPRCHSEDITEPQYSIERYGPQQTD